MDLLLQNTLDGGDIKFVNGDLLGDKTFISAIYNSLLGGNNNWWGNNFIDDQESKLTDDLSDILREPPTTGRLNKISEIAKSQIAWLKENPDVKSYEVICSYNDIKNCVDILVSVILVDGSNYQETIQRTWG